MLRISQLLELEVEGYPVKEMMDGFWIFRKESSKSTNLTPQLESEYSTTLTDGDKHSKSNQCSNVDQTGSGNDPEAETLHDVFDEGGLGNSSNVANNICNSLDMSTSTRKDTQHTVPNWLENLTKNFQTEVVDECSSRTRSAVKKNEKIQNVKDYKKVRTELINTVLSKLSLLFNLENQPSNKDMKLLAHKFSHVYPAMFNYLDDGK